MIILVDSFVRYSLYALLAVIVIWLIKHLLQTAISIKVTKWKHRLRYRSAKKVDKDIGDRSPLYRHISFLLQVTIKQSYYMAVPFFIIITIFLFTGTMLLMFVNTFDLVLSVLIGGFIGGLPYLFLQVKLRLVRTSVSNQLLQIVQAFTQNYAANSLNVYQTLIATRDQIEDKSLKGIFTLLINDMQVSRMESDLRQSINLFIYSSGTTWAKQFGNILLKGFIYDENIQNALINLSEKMEQTESMLEEEISDSYEPRISGYLTLPIFAASLLLGWYVTGPQDWYYLQFQEQYTFITFSLALSLSIISVILSMLMSNQKNDM